VRVLRQAASAGVAGYVDVHALQKEAAAGIAGNDLEDETGDHSMKRRITFTQLKKLYQDPERLKDYEAGVQSGVRAAATFIGEFDPQIRHPYRMEDCVLAKFNLLNRPARRKKSSK
jgi:hypothetical protein